MAPGLRITGAFSCGIRTGWWLVLILELAATETAS